MPLKQSKPSTPEQRARWREQKKRYRQKYGSHQNLTIDLGDTESRLQRTSELDRLAAAFGLGRSAFVRAIADGDLVVKAKAPSR